MPYIITIPGVTDREVRCELPGMKDEVSATLAAFGLVHEIRWEQPAPIQERNYRFMCGCYESEVCTHGT